jgi:hypothetical protein
MATKQTAKAAVVAPKQEIVEVKDDLSYLTKYDIKKEDDGFGAEDTVLPKVKLLQSTSPELEAYSNAKAGEFWHTAFDAPLGTAVKFVICERRKKYLLTGPMGDPNGVMSRAMDAKTWDTLGSWQIKIKNVKSPVTWEIKTHDVAKSGLAEWGTYNPDDKDSGPAATLFYDYLVLLPDHMDLGPCVLSLARTQIKQARKGLNDKIALHASNGRPMQALCFEATVIIGKNDEGQEYKNYLFKSAGFNDEAMFKKATSYKGLLERAKIMDEAGTDEADAPKAGTADDSGEF